jgi:hypothetical protein
MTSKPTTELLNVLKIAREKVAAHTILHIGVGSVPMFPGLIAEIDAHIAWRESGECMEAIASSIAANDSLINPQDYTADQLWQVITPRIREALMDYAKAAIKAMEGGND